MTQRIFLRLVLIFVALLALAAVGVDYFVTRVTAENLRKDLEQALVEEVRLAHSVLVGRPAENNPDVIAEIAERSGARVTIVERDGAVVADSEAAAATMENHANRPELAAALAGRVGRDTRLSRTVGVEFLYVAIPSGDGALRLALPLSDIEARTAAVRSQILGVTLLALIPAIGASVWVARRLSGRLSRVMKFSRRLAAGDYRSSPPAFSGGVFGELWSTLDTTAEQLRSTLGRIEEQRSRLDAVVNATSEGILVVDHNRYVILFNPAMVRLMPAEKLEAGAPLDHWSNTQVAGLFGRVLLDGEPRSLDMVLDDPAEWALRVSCAPIVNADGNRQAAVAVFSDITELEKVDRMRRDFVANVSHELRTPLASVRGYAETLLDGAIDDPAHSRRFVEIIRENADRLTRLTADLMTLSQIEIQAREFEFLPHSVANLISQAADSIRDIATKKGITVEVEPLPEDLRIDCDSQAIHQVLANLLDNALKYTNQDGTIRLGARLAAEDADIYVNDSGTGIPPEHIPRLFERFYRADKARSRALGGTGLGLAIVKHLVLAHGGSVRVTSVVDKGSTFYFRIPIRAKAEEPQADARQPSLF
jgi:two-component system phosphate regulon sensor histidine kinase PhoR